MDRRKRSALAILANSSSGSGTPKDREHKGRNMSNELPAGAPHGDNLSVDAMRWVPAMERHTTRAQAIADGSLIEVDRQMACEARIYNPMTLTAEAWGNCVAWNESDNAKQGTLQDESGRLWDVLTMTRYALSMHRETDPIFPVELYRVPRDGQSTGPRRTFLRASFGVGDDGEAVITVGMDSNWEVWEAADVLSAALQIEDDENEWF